MRRFILLIPILVLVATAATRRPSGPLRDKRSPVSSADAATIVQMRNVDYYVDPRIALHIRQLNGTMSSRAGGPILFDDKSSFAIAIDNADVGLTGPDMSVPTDAFRFDLARYQPQLVAGYSKTLKSGGLEVWMKDIDKITQ